MHNNIILLISQQDYYNSSYASENKKGYSMLYKGDFSYNKSYSGDYLYGAIKRLDKYDKGIVSPLYICFEPKDGTNSEFYLQYFEAGLFNGEIYKIAQEGARNHGLLNVSVTDFFKTHLVNLPSEEQQKIAEILMQCDKVIELKQKRIEEEKKLKKALMQKLLNPDSGVRLPGFSGKWKKYTLGDVANIVSGGTPDTSNDLYWGGDILWCTPTDITLSKKYIENTQQKITKDGLNNSSATMLPVGTILMCSRASIVPRAIAKVPITTNQGFKSFVCKEHLNNEFFYYYIDIILNDFLKMSAGNTFKEISKSDMERYIVLLPSIEEQRVIAKILSTKDDMIELLEQEVCEYKLKKKALMQLLLTGIARCEV